MYVNFILPIIVLQIKNNMKNSKSNGWIKLASVFIAGIFLTHLLLRSSAPINGMTDVLVRIVYPVMVGFAAGFMANGLLGKEVTND